MLVSATEFLPLITSLLSQLLFCKEIYQLPSSNLLVESYTAHMYESLDCSLRRKSIPNSLALVSQEIPPAFAEASSVHVFTQHPP